MFRWRIMMVAGGLLPIVVLYAFFWKLNVPTARDAGEAVRVLQALKERYPFHVTEARVNGEWFRPHPQFTEILIDGKYPPSEQQEIGQIARKLRKEIATKPLRLVFREIRNPAVEITIP